MFSRFALAFATLVLATACTSSNASKNVGGGNGGPGEKVTPSAVQLTANPWCDTYTGTGGALVQERYNFINQTNFDYYQLGLANGQRNGQIILQVKGTYTLNGNALAITTDEGQQLKYTITYVASVVETGKPRLYATDDAGNEGPLDPCD